MYGIALWLKVKLGSFLDMSTTRYYLQLPGSSPVDLFQSIAEFS